MVRGHKDCSEFCQTCKQDCTCACGYCHFCSTKNGNNTIYNNGWGNYSHTHNCNVHAVNLLGKDGEKGPNIDFESLYNLPKLFKSQMYDVTVGSKPDEVTFRAHKEPLSKTSRYFEALFNFDSKIEQSNVILDTDVDQPNAFSCFMQFAYMKDYCCDENGKDEGLLRHAEVYVLAERLEAMDLKDLALRRATALAVNLSKIVVNKETMKISTERAIRALPEVIRIIYENTPSTQPPKREAITEKTKPTKKKETKTSDDAASSEDVTQAILAPSSSQDGFRTLISRLAAGCLTILKGSSTFTECLHDLPEFVQDMVVNLTPGKVLEMDGYGQLKTS